MSEEALDPIWEAVSDRIGDDLRAVVRYGPGNTESRLRADVRDRYSDREMRTLVDYTIINQLSYRRQQDAFDAGELTGVVQRFEEAWVVSRPDSLERKSGVLVSIDRGGDAAVDEVEWCLEYLEGRTA